MCQNLSCKTRENYKKACTDEYMYNTLYFVLMDIDLLVHVDVIPHYGSGSNLTDTVIVIKVNNLLGDDIHTALIVYDSNVLSNRILLSDYDKLTITGGKS